MKGKYFAIILTVFILLSINVAFASELGNETLILHESTLEESVEATPSYSILAENSVDEDIQSENIMHEDIASEGNVGSFKDLKDEITKTASGDELKLEKNYEYNPTTDTGSVGIYTSVVISKPITINGQGHTLDGKNAKTIFTISSISGITLKNIIFKNGYSTGNGGSINAGGAHDLKIINCTFMDSIAPTHGGAIFLSQCNNVTIDTCDFINNAANETSSTRGGAIYWIYGQGGTLTNCNFVKNTAHYGGAVYLEYSNGIHQYFNHYRDNLATNFGGDIFCDDKQADFHDCDFTNSHANNYGGSIYWKGSNSEIYNLTFNNVSAGTAGAIYFTNGNNMTLSKSQFKNSSANNYAGAIYISSPSTTIKNCEFEDSSANYAGVIYTTSKGSKIIDSRFKNSTARTENGGAIYIYAENNVVDNCTFEISTARNGGTIQIYGKGNEILNSTFKSSSATNGGVIYVSGADAKIINNDFIGNKAKTYGGALYLYGNNAFLDENRFIDNVATQGGAILTQSKGANINNSYFRGNNASTYGSAIFNAALTYVNNPTFVYNQAQSTSISITSKGKKFTATFVAKDNILNAIWNNAGVNNIFINDINPMDGAENSNNGELLYQDAREYNQDIIVTEFDSVGNIVGTARLKTGLYGEVNYTATEGTTVKFTHPEDVFYTGIYNEAYVPSFEIKKTPETPKVFEGNDVTFEITVHNNGKIPLTNVVVTEDDFNGLVYKDYVKSNLWTYSKIDGINTWTLTTHLFPDELVPLKVIFAAQDVGILNNTVSVTSDEGISESANASVESIVDTFEAVKLSLIPITKVGEQTIFEIVVHNKGELDIHNVFVVEDSFEGLIFDHTIRDNLWDYNVVDGKHKWVLKESLAGHEYAGIFVVFNTTTTGNFTNYAIIGHEGYNKTVNATVWVNETVQDPDVINPSLNISIETIHPLIHVGNQTMFEIIVHNTGNVPLTAVTVEEYLYDHLIFHDFIIENDLWDYTPKSIPQATRVDLLSAPIVNDQDHTWTMNTPLFVNEYLGFFVIFNSTRTGEFSNTVLGSSTQTPDKKPATDVVRVVHQEYTIHKTALVEGEVNVGDEVTFEIYVQNIGELDLTDIVIEENPGQGLEYVGFENVEGNWVKNGLSWKLNSSVTTDNYAAFIIIFKVTKSGNLTNVIVSGDKTDNASVFVNKTNDTQPDNQTIPKNNTNPNNQTTSNQSNLDNQTTPNNNMNPNNDEEPVDGIDNSTHKKDKLDNTTAKSNSNNYKIVSKIANNATGNPFAVLFIVLACLVLIRRRDE